MRLLPQRVPQHPPLHRQRLHRQLLLQHSRRLQLQRSRYLSERSTQIGETRAKGVRLESIASRYEAREKRTPSNHE